MEALIQSLCVHGRRLDRMCRDALAGIPGVDGIGLTPQPDGKRGAGLSLSYRGWSPSLHFAWTVAYEPLPGDLGDEDEVAEAMAGTFERVIHRQRLRARDADALGHASPLRNGMVDHLQIDRAIASIYLGSDDRRDLVEFVRSTVGAIHNGTTTRHAGGATLGRIGQMVGESVRPDDTTFRYVAPRVRIYRTGGASPSLFTGYHLRIHVDRLPETVLDALVGQPLSTLVKIHPDLDHRVIRRVENDGRPGASTVLIGLDQHLEPLSQYAEARGG